MMKTIVLNIFLETLISFFQDSLINKKYQKNSIYVHYNSFVTVYMFLLSLLINSMYPFFNLTYNYQKSEWQCITDFTKNFI